MKSSILLLAALVVSAGISPVEAKPVKVYIMAGQSNMVGIGQVEGRSERWGSEFSDVKVSVYEGAFDASKNYDPQRSLRPSTWPIPTMLD